MTDPALANEGLAELIDAAQAYMGHDIQEKNGIGSGNIASNSEVCLQCPPPTTSAVTGAPSPGCTGLHSHLDPCCFAPCPVASSSSSSATSPASSSPCVAKPGCCDSASVALPLPNALPACCSEGSQEHIIECQDEACVDDFGCEADHYDPSGCITEDGGQCISVCDGVVAPPSHPPLSKPSSIKAKPMRHQSDNEKVPNAVDGAKYCASCEKVDRTDEDGRQFSSFQELLDCCCCSDVYLDQCCSVGEDAPSTSTASVADECNECFPFASRFDKSMLPPSLPQARVKQLGYPPLQIVSPHFDRDSTDHSGADATTPTQGSPTTTVTLNGTDSQSRSRSASLSVFSSSIQNSPATVSTIVETQAHILQHNYDFADTLTSKMSHQKPKSSSDSQFLTPHAQRQSLTAGPQCLFQHAHIHDERGMCLDPSLTLYSTNHHRSYSAVPEQQHGQGQKKHHVQPDWDAQPPSCCGEHVCQWAGCGIKCGSVSALAEHVNQAHLAALSSSPVKDTGSNLSLQKQQQQQQQLEQPQHFSSDEHAWRCLWDSCGQPALDGALASKSDQMNQVSATDLVLQHILESHLGNAHDHAHAHSPEQRHSHIHGYDHDHQSWFGQEQKHGNHEVKPSPLRTTKRAAPKMAIQNKHKRAKVSQKGDKVNAMEKAGQEEDEDDEDDDDDDVKDDFDESLLAHDCGCPHDGTDGHPCRWQDCERSFPTHEALTSHISLDHIGRGKAAYECRWQGCSRGPERRFMQRQKVMRHIQTHTGDRPFACPLCPRRFSEANTLTQHMRTHTREKPYVCNYPGCGKAFAVAGSLTIHRRMHTGEKPFACPHCDRKFAESSNLTKHARIHTGEKPFACPEPGCSRTFSRPDQMARHRKTHDRAREKAQGRALSAAAAAA